MMTWRIRLTEGEGQARACALLSRVFGTAPTDLHWDQQHHSQGHVHVGDRDLVVIAPCDRVHDPIVLTAEDWDEIRHASGECIGELVRRRAIQVDDRLDILVC